MEHPCQRCGSNVDDSSPFCPNCDAPQIHFEGEGTAPRPVTVAPPITPPAPPTAAFSRPGTPARLDWKHAFRAAMTSGLIAGLLSLLPPVLFLAAPLGGFLAVMFYRRRTATGEPSAGLGFRLGALSGLCGFLLFTLLFRGEIVLTHGENELRSGMVEAIHRQQARAPDAQTRETLDYLLTPHGIFIMMIGGAVLAAIVFVLLSSIGGSVAAALLRRKDGEGS